MLDFIKSENVIQYGEYKLASGKESNIYVNCKKVSLDAKGLHLAIPALFNKLTSAAEFDAVGGMSLGADPIVGAMVYHSKNLKGFIVRKEVKEHGTQKLIEGPVEPGMRVAVVEDVTTTGASAAKAIEAARNFGLEVVVVGTIVNRQEGADDLFDSMKIPFVYLVSKEDFTASISLATNSALRA